MCDICITAHIQGDVQGVGFRYYTQIEARKRSLRGWVRNLSDGSVEICMHGKTAQIKNMQHWLAHGPRDAVVESITFSTASLPDSQQGFCVLHEV